MSAPCIFLDRDKTLIEDPSYIDAPNAVRLLPGVGPALRRLSEAGYKLVIVTNQSGIARGILGVSTLEAIHAELARQLQSEGVRLAGIYYCPYYPGGSVPEFCRESDERKPASGMLLRAARELDLDLAQSWMTGDSPRDIQAGRRAGCRTVFIRSPGKALPTEPDAQPDFTAADMAEAAELILSPSSAAT